MNDKPVPQRTPRVLLSAALQVPVLSISLWQGWQFGEKIGGGIGTSLVAAVCLAACVGILVDWMVDQVAARQR